MTAFPPDDKAGLGTGRCPALRNAVFPVLAGLATVWPALAAEVPGRLAGIAIHAGKTNALVEFQSGQITVRDWLSPGERVSTFELTSIDAAAGTASVSQENRSAVFSLETPVPGQTPTLNLKDAPSGKVLELYQQISGRTVLRSPTLPAALVTLQSGPELSQIAALDQLTRALRERGIFLQPRGSKFVFAAEGSKVPRLAALPEPPRDPVLREKSKSESFPPGLWKFVEADRDQVLDIYQEFSGRTLLRSPALPSGKFTLTSQSELSRDQALWMLETELYLGGISVVKEGRQFAFLLPGNRYAAAPKVPDNPDEARLKKTPYLPAGTLKLGEGSFDGGSSTELLKRYADLVGREPVLDPPPPAVGRIRFRNHTSLHAVEAAYALQALAELNHMRFLAVGANQVKLVPLPKSNPNATR